MGWHPLPLGRGVVKCTMTSSEPHRRQKRFLNAHAGALASEIDSGGRFETQGHAGKEDRRKKAG